MEKQQKEVRSITMSSDKTMGSDKTIEDIPPEVEQHLYHFIWITEKEINKKVYIILFALLAIALLLGFA